MSVCTMYVLCLVQYLAHSKGSITEGVIIILLYMIILYLHSGVVMRWALNGAAVCHPHMCGGAHCGEREKDAKLC